MKILFVGDIVGSVGRKIAVTHIPRIRAERDIDFVIVNGENAAHGKGITNKIYHQLLNAGADMITLGNHAFSKDTIYSFIEDADKMIRPMNIDVSKQGESYRIVEVNGLQLCVVNLLGEVFMNQCDESPFVCMQDILDETDADLYFVDLHGEATSEKIAFSYYFEKDVQAIVGTHTHVQTADERISNGCAFISDVGMCGAYRSVIGRDVEEVLTRFTTKERTRFTVAEGAGIFCAVVIEIDEKTKKAVHIERIQIRPEES